MRSARWIGAAGAAVFGFVVADAATTLLPLSQVAEYGEHPPGTPAGATYAAIELPVTDGAGNFLVEAQLGKAGTSTAGIFIGRRGALQLAAEVGQVAPGTGGLTWAYMLGQGWILRPTGRFAFNAGLANAADGNGGIWAGTVGNLTLVAREGDPAPGTNVQFWSGNSGNRYYGDGMHLAMNDAGVVALRSKLEGAGVTTNNDQAMFAGMPGALALVGRVGDPAPNAGGATFVKSGTEAFTPPSINASGKICFRGHLAGAGVTGNNADAIWYGDPASPAIVVRGDEAVSGTGIAPGSKLVGLGSEPPVINDAGTLLFESIANGGLNSIQAIWLGAPDALAPIAYKGQSAPDDSQNATFVGSFLHFRMNGANQAAFKAALSSGANQWGLYVWDGASLRRVARSGDPAPGLDAGDTFGSMATEDVFINASGDVLFRDAAPSGTLGVWLWHMASGQTTLLARSGTGAINASVDGASKAIIDLTLFSGPTTAGSTQDGRGAPLGDDGTYAILAQFLDGHLAVLTNAAGAATAGAATPSTLSLGATMVVTGSGFGGGAARFKPPTAWLTFGADKRKTPLKIDATTASDGEIHVTVTSLRKGASGTATLHVLPRVRRGIEADLTVTIALPAVASLSGATGKAGDTITITGSYFGSKKRVVKFVAVVGAKTVVKTFAVKSWADGSITVVVPKRLVPKGATSLDGTIEVTNDPGASNATPFTVNG